MSTETTTTPENQEAALPAELAWAPRMDKKGSEYQTAIANVKPQISYFELTQDVVQEANQRARDQIKTSVVEIGLTDVAGLLNIREIHPNDTTTPVQYRVKDMSSANNGKPVMRKFVGLKNLTNRPLSDDNTDHLSDQMSEGLWAFNGENLIFDEDGQCASCQHRLYAMFKAMLANPELTIFAIMTTGVPVELIDTIDQGKKRSNKDVMSRHTHIVPMDIVRRVRMRKSGEDHLKLDGPQYGAKGEEYKDKILADLNSALRMCELRRRMQNVTTSGGKFRQDQLFDWLRWFGKESQSAHPSDVEKLAALCYAIDTRESDGSKRGNIGEFFGRPYAIAILILYCNRNVNIGYYKEPARGKDKFKIVPNEPEDGSLSIDLEFASTFLEQLADSNSPLVQYQYAQWRLWKSKDGEHKRKVTGAFKIECLYRMLQWWELNRSQTEETIGKPGTADSHTVINWTCHGFSTQPETIDGYAAGQSHFGGIDQGPEKKILNPVPVSSLPNTQPVEQEPQPVESVQPVEQEVQPVSETPTVNTQL